MFHSDINKITGTRLLSDALLHFIGSRWANGRGRNYEFRLAKNFGILRESPMSHRWCDVI